jgi:hypothetical protein
MCTKGDNNKNTKEFTNPGENTDPTVSDVVARFGLWCLNASFNNISVISWR